MKTVAQLENFSAKGLYLCLAHAVEPGQRLFGVVRFSAEESDQSGPHVALRGVVLRTELQTDSKYGLAVLIKHHRFL